MRTNCVNCGAAIDIDEQKCPFCGTSYFDLTDIDFTARDPVALRMKVPCTNGAKAMITMLAMPKFGEFNIDTEYVNIYGGPGKQQPIVCFPSSCSANVGVSFTAVPRPRTTELFQVKIAEPSFREELD